MKLVGSEKIRARHIYVFLCLALPWEHCMVPWNCHQMTEISNFKGWGGIEILIPREGKILNRPKEMAVTSTNILTRTCFPPHPIPFPPQVLSSPPSTEPGPNGMLCETYSCYNNFVTCHGIPTIFMVLTTRVGRVSQMPSGITWASQSNPLRVSP